MPQIPTDIPNDHVLIEITKKKGKKTKDKCHEIDQNLRYHVDI